MTTLKLIDKNIKSVRVAGDKLNTLIHETALMVLEHAKAHGDCSRAQVLVMAMPASMRRTSLIAWFSQFSPIVVKNSDDWDAKMQKPETASGAPNPLYRPFDVEGATAKPFYQIANENREAATPASFADLVLMVERITKRIEKQIDDNMIVESDVGKAKAIVRTLEGLNLKDITGVDPADIRVNDNSNSELVETKDEERAAA